MESSEEKILCMQEKEIINYDFCQHKNWQTFLQWPNSIFDHHEWITKKLNNLPYLLLAKYDYVFGVPNIVKRVKNACMWIWPKNK
jgi:hypothetical protein